MGQLGKSDQLRVSNTFGLYRSGDVTSDEGNLDSQCNNDHGQAFVFVSS